MRKKSIYVLHNGTRSRELSPDLRLRLSAAKIIASQDPGADIFFVGGNGLKPFSGANNMLNFWKKENPDISNQTFVLESSSNTAANIEEICSYVNNQKNASETIIISNAYHLERIRLFLKRYALQADVIAAEKILSDAESSQDMPAYVSSPSYRMKIAKEFLLRLYSLVDPDQHMVQLWRTWLRR